MKLDVLCAVAAARAEREAAMLATCLDAAESLGCDVPGLVESACGYHEGHKDQAACA